MSDSEKPPEDEESEEQEAPEPEPQPENFSKGYADQIFERVTKTGPGALNGRKRLIEPRRVTFTLDGSTCEPDIFIDSEGNYEDFQVTLESLDSRSEQEALAGVTDAAQVPFALAQRALWGINGKRIPDDRKAFFWEAFGMGGRQVVLMAFQSIGGASAAALGKYQRSITPG